MIRPVAHYIALLEAGDLERTVQAPVLVWAAPRAPSELVDEVTRPALGMDARMYRPLDAVVFELTRGPEGVSVGRARTNQVQVIDNTMSRAHVRLDFTREGWTVTDLKSKNGTWLGAERLEPGETRSLSDGMRIQLGTVELFFMQPELFRNYVNQVAKSAH